MKKYRVVLEMEKFSQSKTVNNEAALYERYLSFVTEDWEKITIIKKGN